MARRSKKVAIVSSRGGHMRKRGGRKRGRRKR